MERTSTLCFHYCTQSDIAHKTPASKNAESSVQVDSNPSQGCAFISRTVTSAVEVATLNRARMNTPQECLAIEGPHNFIFTLPSVCTGYLVENAATRNIKMNPKCCQDKYFALLHDEMHYIKFCIWFWDFVSHTIWQFISYNTLFRLNLSSKSINFTSIPT